MVENKKKVLELLPDKKISVDEAVKLLALVERPETGQQEAVEGVLMKKKPKYLRVVVEPVAGSDSSHEYDRVNVRVPMSLIRAGVKFSSLIPHDAADKVDGALKEKGINFSMRNIKDEDIEQLIEALGDLEVNVEGKETVRVFTE